MHGIITPPSADNLYLIFHGQVEQVLAGIKRVVLASLKTHPLRERTDAAVKERTAFCLKLARELAMDQRWSGERVVDELPRALVAKLDGVPWEPSSGRVWVPGNQ